MSKISKLYLLLLLLSSISSVQTLLDENETEPIEMKVGSRVEFDENRNYFKFNFTGSNESKIIFDFEQCILYMSLTNTNGETNSLKNMNGDHCIKNYVGNLTENGTYYVKVLCLYESCEIGSFFYSYIIGGIIDTIDLSKKIYYTKSSFNSNNNYFGTMDYNVTGISEDKYVYFRLTENKIDYIPYYPDNPYVPQLDLDTHQLIPNMTPFEVINIKNEAKSERNVKLYKFEKDNDDIIKIHCLINSKEYSSENKNFEYLQFMFFPITLQNFQVIRGDETSLFIDGPTFYLINNGSHKSFFLVPGTFQEGNITLMAKSNETIGHSLENLTKIANLELSSKDIPKSGLIRIKIEEDDPQSTVVFMIPQDYESKMKIFIADEYDDECKNSYLIPDNKNKIIYCYEEKKKRLEYFNNITTYNSKISNMHIIFSEENEGTNYIINNNMRLPIFVEKRGQDQSIFLKKYINKFAYFAAENPYLFKTFFSLGEKYAKYMGINLNNYMKMSPMHFRINSKYLPWLEFYNIYLNQLDLKVNVYIKQIYGGSGLYECNADDVNEKDLTFLTTPISNAKCKNKKSIFNRLFTFDGTKIISGYITPDSYFDGYIEINNDDKTIDISAITKDYFNLPNTARYLKKNVEYTIKFTLNHTIKLEPGFDAEITITNGQTSAKINTQNPTVPVSGNGFTIKSNNDAMVYFFGNFSKELIQEEIDLDKSKGKILRVRNVEDDILLDIGFEGCYPSTIPINFEANGVHYFDNIYDKLKEKLVPGEKVYIYSSADKNKNLKIYYDIKNLGNANNNFNIFLIPGNNEENALAVDSYGVHNLLIDLHFCNKNTIFNLTFLYDHEKEVYRIFTNENYTEKYREFVLSRGEITMFFSSNHPLIYSYSYNDRVDEDFFDHEWEFWNERIVSSKLDIIEAGKIARDDIIKIKFEPNYKQSSTRYIIIIAQENAQHTFEKFEDPCYITELLNQRPAGVKVDTIYDIGDKDSVDAEVDISSIKHNDNKYLVNIISQELRFEKKVNFYKPLEFSQETTAPTDEDQGGGGQGNEEKEEKEEDETNIALAVTLPIIAILIIAIVVILIFYFKKDSSSFEIESKSIQLM